MLGSIVVSSLFGGLLSSYRQMQSGVPQLELSMLHWLAVVISFGFFAVVSELRKPKP